ncbi:uncharacterized protein LOC131802711 [Musca domestica]|uniref:Uncharacterized protein LOC131802710 n=1 Tax=Musca domestica TaxID=7370 RepID=A0A1I8MKY6_MUSDO|nr:uncharacterized protein LOC131802710 [Musca domestica]XP_058979115.1 uncharacterized protein LOC131802711 [Musca domestica]
MVSKFHLFLGIWLLQVFVAPIQADGEKKKLKIVLDKLEKEIDAEHLVKTELKFEKAEGDDEVKINGVVDQLVDFDDNYKITFDISHSDEQDGEYKTVLSTPQKGICEVMQTHYKKFFYESLKEHCNAPDPDVCPVTKEKYEVKDYPLDSSKFQNYLRPGFYRVVATVLHNEEEVLKYRVESHTEEEA